MHRSRNWMLTGLAAGVVCGWVSLARAELTPGVKLTQANCNEAKNLLPDPVVARFCAGQYAAEIVAITDSALLYSKKFREGSEANVGKYYVTKEGYLYETASKTWPRYWYGFPFPDVDPQDPQAAYKIMYNHQIARYQADDTYWFLAIKWATPTGFDRSIDVGAYATAYIGRHSGPLDNSDETYLKDIIFGVAPYDVVGVATLEWWTLDPEKWQSLWAYVPSIRRVRRLSASNSSEGMFGSVFARDDPYGWAGKIQYMNWTLVGTQEMLVPIPPTGIEKAMTPGPPAAKEVATDPSLIKDRGVIPPGQVARITWEPEDQVKLGYEDPTWRGLAWAPTQLKLARRTCWVVEATPKDPYYAYGRRIVYIDKDSYAAYWGILYDRAGEHWKTMLYMDKLAYTPDRELTIRHPFWALGEDVRQNRASFFDVQSRQYFTEYQLGFPDSNYTATNLSAMGK